MSSHDQFITIHREILSIIDDYNTKVKFLESLQREKLRLSSASGSTLSTIFSEENCRLREQIDVNTTTLQSMQHIIKDSIEHLKSHCDHNDADQVNQINNLNRNFRKSLRGFLLVQSSYREKVAEEEIELDLQQQEIQKQVPFHLLGIYDRMTIRNSEIAQAEKSAMELNELWTSLHDVVVEQEAPIDRINDNLSKADVDIEQGDSRVVDATENARQSRIWKHRVLIGGVLVAVSLLPVLVVCLALKFH